MLENAAFFPKPGLRNCESLNALNWETVSQKLTALGFGYFVKQKKLLLGNGKRGILLGMGSVRVTNMGCVWYVTSQCSFAVLPSAWWGYSATSSSTQEKQNSISLLKSTCLLTLKWQLTWRPKGCHGRKCNKRKMLLKRTSQPNQCQKPEFQSLVAWQIYL